MVKLVGAGGEGKGLRYLASSASIRNTSYKDEGPPSHLQCGEKRGGVSIVMIRTQATAANSTATTITAAVMAARNSDIRNGSVWRNTFQGAVMSHIPTASMAARVLSDCVIGERFGKTMLIPAPTERQSHHDAQAGVRRTGGGGKTGRRVELTIHQSREPGLCRFEETNKSG